MERSTYLEQNFICILDEILLVDAAYLDESDAARIDSGRMEKPRLQERSNLSCHGTHLLPYHEGLNFLASRVSSSQKGQIRRRGVRQIVAVEAVFKSSERGHNQ